MTYHLGRVVHWMHNKNVNPYPTYIDRQVTQPPLAEYYLLHIHLLTAYTPVLNFVQWLFFAASILVVSLIVRSLGGDRKMQLYSMFFTATMPMAILQSNSTQNDIVLGFFMLCAVYFLLALHTEKSIVHSVLLFSVSCGLALITKGVALIFLLPVVPVFTFLLIRKTQQRSPVYILFTIAVICLLTFPYATRNYTVYRSPLGNAYNLNNDCYSFQGIFGNSTKNIAIQLRTPFPKINDAVTRATVKINTALGVDTFSETYNWHYSPRFSVGYFSTQEDTAGNFLHTLLGIVCLVLLMSIKSLRRSKWLLLAVLPISMFLLFNLILKWQVWHVRLFVSIGFLLCGVLACCVNRWPVYLRYTIILLFCTSASLFLFFNNGRPLLGKNSIFTASGTEQYFANNKPLQPVFEKITELMLENNVEMLGYVASGDAWEYPLWALSEKNVFVEHIDVPNATRNAFRDRLEKTRLPEMIVSNHSELASEDVYVYAGVSYFKIWRDGNWSAYLK
ncbi:MAG: phospholipid carrier-dependent glycosyltransferase [Chitinophagales bacterium]